MKFFHVTVGFLVFAQAVLSLPVVSRSSNAASWSYLETIGPENWGKAPVFHVCGDKSALQSPIDIRKEDLKDAGRGMMRSMLRPRDAKYAPKRDTNNCAFMCEKGQTCSTLTLGDDDEVFTLKQFHIHVPSEHKINGEQMDGEIHLVHTGEDNEIRVVSVLLKAVADDDGFNGQIVDLSKPMKSINDGLEFEFKLTDLIRPNSGFYRYEGSLTTPPCTTGVTFVVQKEMVGVKQEQLKEFMNMIGPRGRGNYRPVQPLNGRTIESFKASA